MKSNEELLPISVFNQGTFHPEQMPRYLRHIANLYLKEMSKELGEIRGIMYFDVLLVLFRNGGLLFQKQLSALLYIDKSSMVAIIDYLHKGNFIDVLQNPTDRRENKISLSQAGLSAISKIKKAESKLYQTMFDKIPEDQVNSFFNLLLIIESRLK